jgi:hypothetical protein
VNVVSESLKAKAVILVQDFLQARDSIYRRDWSELPWRFVFWGLEKAGLIRWSGEKAAYGRYVVLANVEACSSLKD